MSDNICNSKFKTNVEVIITKEDNLYVAYCPAIEVSGYGDTIENTKASLNEEIQIFLEETFQRGTLEKYLLKQGWFLIQVPELKYEPPRLSMNKLFSLLKVSEQIITQEIVIPVC